MAVKNDPVQEVFRRHGIDDPTVFLEEHRKEAGVKFSPSVQVLVRGDAFLMLKRLSSLNTLKTRQKCLKHFLNSALMPDLNPIKILV